MDNFFATSVDNHLAQAGQIHAYLLPSGAAQESLGRFLPSLEKSSIVAPQPVEALHITVARFKQPWREDLPRLVSLLAEAPELHALSPLRGSWSEPFCGNSSLIVKCHLSGWQNIIAATNAAAKRVLGGDVVCYPPPFAAHLTLAYGVADGDDSQVLGLVEEGRDRYNAQLPGTAVFDALAWCFVWQNLDAGTYTFKVLGHTFFIGGSEENSLPPAPVEVG